MLAQIATTILGFFLLVVVLRKLFWQTILKLLDERRQRIEDGFKNLEHAKQDVARLQLDYQQRLAKIEEEARSKIQQSILEGKRVSMEIQEQARAQGAALLTKSKETIELELAKAKVTLRDQIASMTMEAVEKVLRRKLDEKTDRQLVDTVLTELEQEHLRG